MHLYLSNDFIPLRQLLFKYDDQTKFDYLNTKDQIGMNMWLIHTTTDKSRVQLADILKLSHIYKI